jgi:hypothetical protein
MKRAKRRQKQRWRQIQGQAGRREEEGAETEAEAEISIVGEERKTGRGSETKMMEIWDFSCPDGRISHGRSILEPTYIKEKVENAELARELSRLRKEEVQGVPPTHEYRARGTE